jgi:hypothetical protein
MKNKFLTKIIFILALIILGVAIFLTFKVMSGCYPSSCSGGVCTADCMGSPPSKLYIMPAIVFIFDLLLWIIFIFLATQKPRRLNT